MTKFNREDDKEVLAKAEPFVRAILAFLIFTFRQTDLEASYECADRFIENLEKDLSDQ